MENTKSSLLKRSWAHQLLTEWTTNCTTRTAAQRLSVFNVFCYTQEGNVLQHTQHILKCMVICIFPTNHCRNNKDHTIMDTYKHCMQLKDWHKVCKQCMQLKHWHEVCKHCMQLKDWHEVYKRCMQLKDWHEVYKHCMQLKDWHEVCKHCMQLKDWHEVYKYYKCCMQLKDWHEVYKRWKLLKDSQF